MNNPRTYQVLSILGFIVSAIFTVKLFSSNSTDIISWFAMVATALLYEFGKYTLLFQTIKGPFGATGKTIMLGSWIFVTCASIIASAAYVLNDANSNKNLMVESSAAYRQQQNSIAVKNDLYSTTKKQIEDLKALQGKQQQEGNNIVNAMPSNYIDRKNQQRSDTRRLIAKTQEQINNKSEELNQIAKDLSSPLGEIKVETESTTGGYSMFKLITQKLNDNPKNKKNPYSIEEVGVYFYIAIGVGLELLANLFAFLSQYYEYGKLCPTPLSPEKKQIPELQSNKPYANSDAQEIKGGRLKGLKFRRKDNISIFRPRPNEIIPLVSSNVDEGDIEKYLKFVIENASKNGNAPGRIKISAGTGIAQEKCRTIHNILIERGILETGDKFTKIIRKVV